MVQFKDASDFEFECLSNIVFNLVVQVEYSGCF